MKTNYLFSFVVVIMLIFYYGCVSSDDNRLIKYIENNKEELVLSGSGNKDSLNDKIIEYLESVKSFNNLVVKSTDTIKDSRVIDSLRIAYLPYNVYIDRVILEFKTKPVRRGTASGYYNNSLRARREAKAGTVSDEILLDSTDAILFTLPHIIKGLDEVFHPSPANWIDSSWWQNKGLILYPANYGVNGDTTGTNKWQSTVIIQIARDTFDTKPNLDNWRVEPGKLYDFGDLKPPKIRITNVADSPK